MMQLPIWNLASMAACQAYLGSSPSGSAGWLCCLPPPQQGWALLLACSIVYAWQ